MSDEDRTIEELQERIRNLELSLKYTKEDLENTRKEGYKTFTDYMEESKENREIRDALRKEKNTSKIFSVATVSLFLFICIFIGIITAYGSDPDVFREAIYNTSFWSVLKMILNCVGSIVFDFISLFVYCFICAYPTYEFTRCSSVEEHPYALFSFVAFLSGIFIAFITIKNIFW